VVCALALHCMCSLPDAHTTPPHSRRPLPVHVSLQAMEVDAPLPQLPEARPNKGSRVALYLRPIAPSPSCRQLHMLIGDGVNRKWGGAHVTLCSFAPEHASGEPGPIIVPSHPSSRKPGLFVCHRALCVLQKSPFASVQRLLRQRKEGVLHQMLINASAQNAWCCHATCCFHAEATQ